MNQADGAAATDAGLAAVLLDLDGTLVDTSPAWRQAYTAVATAHGRTLAEGWWAEAAGRSMAQSTTVLGVDPVRDPGHAAALADELSVRATTALAAGGEAWTWRPGAAELLAALEGAAVPFAVVTAVARTVAIPLLAAMGVTPAVVVTGDDVVRGKPAPDAYLVAAARLGTGPARCLVVEDSPTGAAAAAAAGIAAVVVPHAGPVAAAPGRDLRSTLVGLDPAALRAAHARLRSAAAAGTADPAG